MGQPNGPALAHQIAFVPRRQIKGWLSADVGVLFAIEFQDRRGAAWRRSEGPMTRQTFLQIVSSGFSNTADNESATTAAAAASRLINVMCSSVAM